MLLRKLCFIFYFKKSHPVLSAFLNFMSLLHLNGDRKGLIAWMCDENRCDAVILKALLFFMNAVTVNIVMFSVLFSVAGPYRMRKKMIRNNMFYVHYPFKADLELNV